VLPIQNLQIGDLAAPLTLGSDRSPVVLETAPSQPHSHDHRPIHGKGTDIPVALISKIETDHFVRLLEVRMPAAWSTRGNRNPDLFLAVGAVGFSFFRLLSHEPLPFPFFGIFLLGPGLPDILHDLQVVLLHLTGGNLEEWTEGTRAGLTEFQADTAGWIVC
jgi:hypothetical protein